MAAEPRAPFSVALCNAMIRAAAQLVPAAQQQEWKREWFGEIWYRWQFLRQVGEWNYGEALRLVRDCLGVFADAGWHFASQEQVQSRLREWARSPWLCLGVLAVLLAAVGAMSGGFAATRQLFFSPPHGQANLFSIWLHPVISGGDKGLPPDLAPGWAKHSRLLESAAGFTTRHASVSSRRVPATKLLVVTSEPSLFTVFGTKPELGAIPRGAGVVLGHRAWISVFHANPQVVGSEVAVGGESYRVAAVLPADFQFLSRQPSIYVVQHELGDPQVMVVLRAKPGVTQNQLDRELTRIAEDCCYYFYSSQLRLRYLRSAMLTPVRFFGMAVLIGALMVAAVSRIGVRHWRVAWATPNRSATLRRTGFFVAKTGLALAVVFAAGLEWSRSESSFLVASKDPASGPFLVWLYILGAMGVLFWSLADQRARCRVCLRLLCFPVRIGCPGCLLLDWSGTELLCTEGHGVLHVPLLAASWDEEAERWIALDESWQELFAQSR
jgi:hypothetical protein